MSDVVVFGLDTETVPLDDIMMDIPHARTVTIPAEKALRSKDLWRAISQKRIFRLSPDPNPPKLAPPPPSVAVPVSKPGPSPLESRLTEIEAENVGLKGENASLRTRIEMLEAIMTDQGKLDEILRLLQKPQVVSFVSPVVSKVAPEDGVVEVNAPAFVPSEIRMKDMETRVEVNSETSQGGSVSGASSALRRLRQGQ